MTAATNKLVLKFLGEHYGDEAVQLWKEKAEKQFLSLSNGKKDPDAPARPLSAYNFFMKEQMEKLKKKSPDAKLPELSKIVSAEWNKIKGDAKKNKKYVDLAEKDKARYKEEMESYEPPEGFSAPKKSKAKKDGPKGPKSAYIIFFAQIRPEIVEKNPDASPTEVMKLVGEAWNKIKGDEKELAKYKAMAEADKERYLAEGGGGESSGEKKKKTMSEETKKPAKGKKGALLASKKISKSEDKKPAKGKKGALLASKKITPRPTVEDAVDSEDDE